MTRPRPTRRSRRWPTVFDIAMAMSEDAAKTTDTEVVVTTVHEATYES